MCVFYRKEVQDKWLVNVRGVAPLQGQVPSAPGWSPLLLVLPGGQVGRFTRPSCPQMAKAAPQEAPVCGKAPQARNHSPVVLSVAPARGLGLEAAWLFSPPQRGFLRIIFCENCNRRLGVWHFGGALEPDAAALALQALSCLGLPAHAEASRSQSLSRADGSQVPDPARAQLWDPFLSRWFSAGCSS